MACCSGNDKNCNRKLAESFVEGCYIPLDWKKDFSNDYLESIKFFCLVMSENYIRAHFDDIKRYAGVIEKRMNDED